MAIPQTMLSVVARDEVHLQFRLKDDVDRGQLFKALGKLWESELTGIADPTLNKHHQLTGGTANVVLGFKPELWREVLLADAPDSFSYFYKGNHGTTRPGPPRRRLRVLLGGPPDDPPHTM